MKFKFKSCYAEGDRCHGCDHYKGKAPICIYAPKQVDEGVRAMKDTVTYPLSAIMDEDEESRIDQLERELVTARAELAEAIAKERERCARVCEEFYSVENIAQKCAAAIRKGE